MSCDEEGRGCTCPCHAGDPPCSNCFEEIECDYVYDENGNPREEFE